MAELCLLTDLRECLGMPVIAGARAQLPLGRRRQALASLAVRHPGTVFHLVHALP